MKIKKLTITFLICILAVLCLYGCSISFLSNSNSNGEIPYTSFTDKASSTEEILQILLIAMESNKNSCELLISNESLIDAESWMGNLVGIEQIHCEYRKVKEGFNVVVTFQYWDNYAIVNAYENNNTSNLNQRQLEMYNKYMEVIDEYTSPNRSDCANELSIHDYLVTNVVYEAQENSIYNAYDALIKGKSVCSGYAEAFKTFMDILGIENKTLSGIAGNQQHIWNLVKLDGEWYQVDVTWDDPINSSTTTVDHAYFNLTDSEMAKDHTWDTSQNGGLKATGVKYSYPQYAGLVNVSSQSELTSYIVKCINNRASYIEFTSNQTLDLKSAMAASDTTLSYSYKIVERPSYSIYIVSFSY